MRQEKRAGRLCVRAVLAAVGLSVSVLSANASAAEIVVTWTGAGGDQRWANPLNWSPNVVPINTPIDQYVVRIQSGTQVIVDSALPPTFAVNTLEVGSDRTLQITGGRSISVLNASGVTGRLRLTGGSQFQIQPAAGGTLVSPTYTELLVSEGSRYTHALNTLTLQSWGSSVSGVVVTGAGSSGDFRNVTTVTLSGGGSNPSLPIRAANGGTINLSNFRTYTPSNAIRLSFEADGGTINLASLISAPQMQLVASNGGTLNLPSLSSINDTFVWADNAQITLPLVTSILSTGTSVRAVGTDGRLSLPSLTSVSLQTLGLTTEVGFSAESGGVLSLPALTTVAMGNLSATSGVSFRATNQSQLVVPALNSVTGQGLTLDASINGFVSLPLVSGTLTRASIRTVSGGVINIPNITGLLNSSVYLTGQPAGFGTQLTSVDGTSWTVLGNTAVTLTNVVGTVSETPEKRLSYSADSGGSLSMPSVTSISTRANSELGFTVFAGRLEFPVLQTVTGGAQVRMTLSAGGQIVMPQLTSMGQTTVFMQSPGTRLDLPSLVTSGPLSVTAEAGTQINLPALTTITGTGTLSLTLRAGSQANLPNFTQTAGAVGISALDAKVFMDSLSSLAPGSSISAGTTAGSAITGSGLYLPSLTSLQGVRVSLNGNAQLQTGQLTSLNNSIFVLSGGASYASSGAIDTFSTTNFVEPAFQVGSVGSPSTLNFSGIRTLHNDSTSAFNALTMRVEGGLLNLSGVTQLTARTPGTRTEINVTSGRADLSGLQTANTGLTVSATGGEVDLSSLRSINASALSSFSASGSGVIRLNNLQTISGGTGSGVSIFGTDTRIVAPLLTSFTGIEQIAFGASGGTLTLPLVESLGSGTTLSLSSGVSGNVAGVLRLPLLQTLGSNTRQTIQISGATGLTSQIVLPVLTSLGTSTQRRVIQISSGTLVVPALTQVLDTDFQLSSANAFQASGALTSVDGSTFSLSDLFVLPSGVTSYSTRSLPAGPILTNTSSGAVANFSSLRSITAGLSSAERSFFAVNAAGGTIDLSGLTTINSINAGGLDFTVNAGGTLRLNALTSLSFSRLNVAGTGQVVAPLLQSLDTGSVRVSSGGVFTSVPGATSYRTGELPGSTANVTRTIFSATSGGRLNLSSLLSLEFGRASTPGAFYTISSTGANSRVDLSGLQSLTPINGGGLILTTSDSGTILLGPITALNRVFLTNSNTTPFVLPSSLTNIDGSELTGSVTVPQSVRSYTNVNGTSSRYPFYANNSSVISLPGVEQITLGSSTTPGVVHTFRADGSGGRIGLAAAQNITLINGATLELLSGGGAIDLPQLRSIDQSSGGGVRITVSSASPSAVAPLINLASLPTLTRATVSVLSPGNTTVTTPNLLALTSLRSATASSFSFNAPMDLPALDSLDFVNTTAADGFVAGSGVTRMDRLGRVTVGSTTTTNAVTTIAARNNGSIVAPWLSTFESVNGGVARLEVISGTITLPTLTVSPTVRVITTGATPAQQTQPNGLILSGSLLNRSTDYRDFDLWRGVVNFLPGTNALLEAAGPNAGPGLPSGDFVGVSGIGQLRIGAPSAAAASITVIDLFNNGRRLGGAGEALYLFGPQSPIVSERDGLMLMGGSRLILSPNVDVYAAIDGVLTNLRSLIPAGQTQVAFGGGFIVIPTPGTGLTVGGLLMATGGLPGLKRRRRTARAG